jgi:hypothetical protein
LFHAKKKQRREKKTIRRRNKSKERTPTHQIALCHSQLFFFSFVMTRKLSVESCKQCYKEMFTLPPFCLSLYCKVYHRFRLNLEVKVVI